MIAQAIGEGTREFASSEVSSVLNSTGPYPDLNIEFQCAPLLGKWALVTSKSVKTYVPSWIKNYDPAIYKDELITQPGDKKSFIDFIDSQSAFSINYR